MAIMTKAERQSHIESRHLFKCHCPECELTGAALRRSNNDRKRFKSLVHPVNGAFPPDFHLFTTMYSSVTEEQLPKAQMQKLAPKMQFLAPKMQFLFPAGSTFPAGKVVFVIYGIFEDVPPGYTGNSAPKLREALKLTKETIERNESMKKTGAERSEFRRPISLNGYRGRKIDGGLYNS